MNQIKRLLALCSLAVALPWFGPLPQTQPAEPQVHITQVDTSQFPKVTVYISAMDANGEPVGIDPNRLVLSENGVAVKFQQVSGSGEIGPLTTLLVMDVSGSMNDAGKLQTAKAAAKAYVAQMRPGDQAGLLTFNTEINYVQALTASHEALAQAIDGLKADKDTAMYDALVQAEAILGRVAGRKAIIALTDGLDNRSTHTADQVIEQIGPSGLSISTIGLGDPSQLRVSNAGLDEAALRSLAQRAGGDFGYANDPDSLRALYQRYAHALQTEYGVTYISPAALRDGVNRTLTVRLAEASQPAVTTAYNPGGLVPEVRRVSWPLFLAALLGLLALLAAPMLVSRGFALARARWPGLIKAQKKGRIRLADRPEPRIRLR